MKFPPKALRLLSVRTIEKKDEKGQTKTYHFARFADEATFEANDFMLPKTIDPASLVEQTRYNVEIDIDGRFTNISLTPAADTINLNLKKSQS